jgi:hypothetical protein
MWKKMRAPDIYTGFIPQVYIRHMERSIPNPGREA